MSKNFHKEQIKRFLLEERADKDEEPELLNEIAITATIALVAAAGALGYGAYKWNQANDIEVIKYEFGQLMRSIRNPDEKWEQLWNWLDEYYIEDATAQGIEKLSATMLGLCLQGHRGYCRSKRFDITGADAADKWTSASGQQKILRARTANTLKNLRCIATKGALQCDFSIEDIKNACAGVKGRKFDPDSGKCEAIEEDDKKDDPTGSKGPSFGNLKKAKGVVKAVYGSASKVFVPGVSSDRFYDEQRILFSTTYKDSFGALAKGKCDLGSMYYKSTDSCERISRPELKISSQVVNAYAVPNGTRLTVNKGKNWGINVGASVSFPGASSSSGTDKDKRGNKRGRWVKCSPKLLKKRCRGPLVTKLQTRLAQLKYNLGKHGVDGKYGGDTATAVSTFQKASGLAGTGVADEKTLTALYGGEAKPKSSLELSKAASGPAGSKAGEGKKGKIDYNIEVEIKRALKRGVPQDVVNNIVKNYDASQWGKKPNSAWDINTKLRALKESSVNKTLADHKEQVLIERLEKLIKGLV